MAAPTVTFNNGYKMPMLGLGTWDAIDEAEIERSLNAALENGYRHIDTAWSYRNEKVIGKVLKKCFESGKLKREDLFITTKLPLNAIRADKVEEYIKNSLASLQLDYVDLYLIHWPFGLEIDKSVYESLQAGEQPKLIPNTDHEAIWKKFEEQVEAGRTKSIGLSNYNIKQVERILKAAVIKPQCLQVENHVFLQQEKLVEFCQKNRIVVVGYSPLANPGRSKFIKRIGREVTEPLPDILSDARIAQIAKKHNRSVAQIALRFLIERNVIPIPKSVTEKRVKENISIFDFKLDADDMNVMKKLDVGEKARICNLKIMSPDFVTHFDYPFGV